MSWIGPPPSRLTWSEKCKELIEYYWKAKRNPSDWHFAFDCLAYLQYYIYEEFIKYFESYKEATSIIEFENWWNGFKTFTDEMESVYTCISPGIPKEISKIYSAEFDKSQPEWRYHQMQSFWNYYKEFFPQFLALREQSNMIENKIREFRENNFNAILESNVSFVCITIFGIILISVAMISLYMLQSALRFNILSCDDVFWTTTGLFIIGLISLMLAYFVRYKGPKGTNEPR